MKLIPWRRGPSQFQRAAEGSMTLMEHFLELRSRLFKATLAITAGLVVGFLLSLRVWEVLQAPYCDLQAQAGRECGWNLLAPTDDFMLRLRIALWVGIVVAAPIWLYQLWAFVAPGLHRRERRWAYGFGALAIPLFAAGAALAFAVVGHALEFLADTGVTQTINQLEPTRYFSFISTLVLVFGLAFQFPVLLLLLNFSGLVSAARMLRAWRVVIFICFAFSAVFTPDPGPFGMVLLAACLSVLYFAAVGVAFLNDRRRARRDRQLYGDLADDEISPLDHEVEPVDGPEPVAAAEPVEAVTPVPDPAPLERRYDELT